MELPKYYLFENREDAQALIDKLTIANGEKTPYTEVRESNNGQGYAVRTDDFTKTVTDKTSQYLPINFYID